LFTGCWLRHQNRDLWLPASLDGTQHMYIDSVYHLLSTEAVFICSRVFPYFPQLFMHIKMRNVFHIITFCYIIALFFFFFCVPSDVALTSLRAIKSLVRIQLERSAYFQMSLLTK